MTRPLEDAFIAAKNAETNQPINLYTLYDYDGLGNDLTYAEYDSNVVYDGVTYFQFPVTYDNVSENMSGEIDTIQIKVANVTRDIEGYLENYDLRAKKISIKAVWADELSDPLAFSEDIYWIDSIQANQTEVVFTCASKFDIMELTLPNRQYTRNYCTWKFKGTECAYAGGETECNRTWQRCNALGNEARFGGFPSVPGKRIAT